MNDDFLPHGDYPPKIGSLMSVSRKLVSQHMESVAADLLEEYQAVIRDCIRGKHGIYALYRRERLYYVGLATNLRARLKHHLRDRHKGLWDRFSVYLIRKADHIRELESLVLRIVKPSGNRALGKLQGSINLKKQLTTAIRRQHRIELERLVGRRGQMFATSNGEQSAGVNASIRAKKAWKTRRASDRKQPPRQNAAPDAAPLKGLVSRRLPLRAKRKGKVIKATLLRNGWIKCGKWLYRTPSTAATDICGSNCNGWHFWKYQKSPGNWVPLGELR